MSVCVRMCESARLVRHAWRPLPLPPFHSRSLKTLHLCFPSCSQVSVSSPHKVALINHSDHLRAWSNTVPQRNGVLVNSHCCRGHPHHTRVTLAPQLHKGQTHSSFPPSDTGHTRTSHTPTPKGHTSTSLPQSHRGRTCTSLHPLGMGHTFTSPPPSLMDHTRAAPRKLAAAHSTLAAPPRDRSCPRDQVTPIPLPAPRSSRLPCLPRRSRASTRCSRRWMPTAAGPSRW